VLYEFKVIQHLGSGCILVLVFVVGIPKLYWCGSEGDHNVMVMELLGSNMEELFNLYHRKFSLKTVLMIADQMVKKLLIVDFKAKVCA
jgi:hypothetical protein